jgi:hypothetical protein
VTTDNNVKYFDEVYGKLGGPEAAVGRSLGITESVIVGLMTGRPLSRPVRAVLPRFYLALILFDLWNASPIHTGKEMVTQKIVGDAIRLLIESGEETTVVISICKS